MALEQNELKRYSRQIMLPQIGQSGQQALGAAKVLVVGAGGLGCPVLQYLAAAGVGCIGVADGDVVEITNLQRQVLYGPADVGKPKAACAAERLRRQNELITVVEHREYVHAANVLELVNGYDVIVDGSDNFATRYLLNDACLIANKPLVSGAIFRFEGQVSVFNYEGGPTYRCLFAEPPEAGASPNCAEIGVVATLPGIVGTIQANEVIKIITRAGNVLSGRLLVIDALSMNTHTFGFAATAAGRTVRALEDNANDSCALLPQQISYTQLLELVSAGGTLIDVREPHEHASANIGGLNVPLGEISSSADRLDKQQAVVLYCAMGKRSLAAGAELMRQGFREVYSLEGGLNSI